MAPVDGFGPEGLPSALVLTFDNLGEAAALERGDQPHPSRSDPSVTTALPWLLDELDRHRLTATFFVEAINCELYPEAVREIADRGHELGHHGWSHERWRSLAAEDERDALARGLAAFEALGLRRPRGFRPPGGELNEHSPALLREHGFEWCSPAGDDAAIDHGLVYLPFEWELVDAFHLMDSFASLRTSRGASELAAAPAELAERLIQRLDATDGWRTLILHPFLMLDGAWAVGVSQLLHAIAEQPMWVVGGGAFADWMRTCPGSAALAS
jgi:peptidoglycan/xylan/chitin deacetylase (PgdA/CDA1 family)